MKNWMSIAIAALMLIVGGVSSASADSPWGANYFPNVALTTQDGKTVHFYDDVLKGKTVAIYLMYTTCGYSCPLETARMVQVKNTWETASAKTFSFTQLLSIPNMTRRKC